MGFRQRYNREESLELRHQPGKAPKVSLQQATDIETHFTERIVHTKSSQVDHNPCQLDIRSTQYVLHSKQHQENRFQIGKYIRCKPHYCLSCHHKSGRYSCLGMELRYENCTELAQGLHLMSSNHEEYCHKRFDPTIHRQ